MAQHAILTNKSNQRIAAAVAVSGLVGTGLALPFAQVALAAPDPCTITSDGSNPASAATLRAEIDAAIANVNCSVVEINNTTDSPLNLEVGSAIYVGPEALGSSPDPRTSMTIRSSTGLNIFPTALYPGSLMELQDSTFWHDSAFSGWNYFQSVTIEGLTFRDADDGAIDGESFGFPNGELLEIKNSRFTNNQAITGGAIRANSPISVSNSIFIGNQSLSSPSDGGGGAIWTLYGAEISSSLFMNNEALGSGSSDTYDGGAVYAVRDIRSVNSTYLNNRAERGGALYAYLDVQLALNTFEDNYSYWLGRNAYSSDDTFLWGNISRNDDGFIGFGYEDGLSDLGYNLFTSSQDFDVSSDTSRLVTIEELAFGEYPDPVALSSFSTPVTTAPSLPISSTSVAAGFVKGSFPDADFDDFFNDKISVDQLGTSRGSSVDAGAHQVTVRRSSGGTAAVVAPAITPKEALVPGFAPNSTKLTKSMKKEIRSFLKANPNLKNVVCKGYTSSPSTPQDRALARKRGKVTCDYILTLRPDAQVTIRSGSHTNKPGSQIRRVNIKLS